MNPRSTDRKAKAVTTTPSRRSNSGSCSKQQFFLSVSQHVTWHGDDYRKKEVFNKKEPKNILEFRKSLSNPDYTIRLYFSCLNKIKPKRW